NRPRSTNFWRASAREPAASTCEKTRPFASATRQTNSPITLSLPHLVICTEAGKGWLFCFVTFQNMRPVICSGSLGRETRRSQSRHPEAPGNGTSTRESEDRSANYQTEILLGPHHSDGPTNAPVRRNCVQFQKRRCLAPQSSAQLCRLKKSGDVIFRYLE